MCLWRQLPNHQQTERINQYENEIRQLRADRDKQMEDRIRTECAQKQRECVERVVGPCQLLFFLDGRPELSDSYTNFSPRCAGTS